MEFIFKEDYVLAVCENYPPFIIDYDTYNGKTEDELEWEICALHTYHDIAMHMKEFGDPDDWE